MYGVLIRILGRERRQVCVWKAICERYGTQGDDLL